MARVCAVVAFDAHARVARARVNISNNPFVDSFIALHSHIAFEKYMP